MGEHGIPVSVEMTPRGQKLIERQAQERAYDAAIKYAADLGAEHGRNAASWYFDGNTTARTYAWALKGIEDGDPEVLDTLPAPDLSGEWADRVTGPELVQDAIRSVTGDDRETETLYAAFSDICDAYEAAFSQAATDVIEATARQALRS